MMNGERHREVEVLTHGYDGLFRATTGMEPDGYTRCIANEDFAVNNGCMRWEMFENF